MTEFVDHNAMIAAAEREVRDEARRHPDDPWTLDGARRYHSLHGDQATPEFATAVADARKRLRNELLAERYRRVEQAVNSRDWFESRGWAVPLWARNTLAWAAEPSKITALYEFDDDDNVDLDEALAVLSRAVA